jgi:holliday junction DNA helicase RuvA
MRDRSEESVVIASLRGTVVEVGADQVVIETGGVGFAVSVPAREAARLSRSVGEQASLTTYLHVREDALQLFGFADARSRGFFLLLMGVSGVGPKVALGILSTYAVEDLEAAVVRGDAERFESVPGIGKKLAQRLILELKDRVSGDLAEALTAAPALADVDQFVAARSALQGLGMSLRQAEEALKGAPDDAPLEDLVRFALTRKSDG